jgi:hypothetical protein
MKTKCDKELTFEECELAILRSAVDKNEKMIQYTEANKPEIKKMIAIVEEFIRQKKLICYGGTAINNILPKEEQFYNYKYEVPDYDFFSTTPLEHAKELANLYYENGFDEVEAKAGVHHGTYKVFVNYIAMADITYIHPKLFKSIKQDSIKILDIYYCAPNYLRMSMFLELSRPKGDISRWEKVMKRAALLNKYYPLNSEKCKYENFQRSFEGKPEYVDVINNTVKAIAVREQCIFFGGYANYLYSKYMNKTVKNKFSKHPDFDLLSIHPKETAHRIKEELENSDFKNITIKKHDGFMDLLKSHYEVIVNKDTICFVYEPIACHSYNVIKIKDIRYRIATIDTMLSFYLLFIYLDKPYYNIDRILCMSQFLFDVQQKNRLSQKGLLRRFSISCYGNQKSIGDIFQEKSKLMRELSVNPDEKKKEKWFLKYRPESNKSITRTRKMKFTFDDISNDETGVFTSIALKTINKTRKKRKKKKVPLKNALSFPLNILKDF